MQKVILTALPHPALAQGRRQRSLTQNMVEQIQAQIQSGQLQPGGKLPSEAQLVSQFNVSRTVVREALSKLQAAGSIDTQHGIGSFVRAQHSPLDLGITAQDGQTSLDVLAILELRASLEIEAAGLAAQRRTDQHLSAMRQALREFAANIKPGGDTIEPDMQFHLSIAQATGNRYFIDVMDHLGQALLPRTRINTAQYPQTTWAAYLHRINQEHEHIYDSIARQDTESARAAMRAHLRQGSERQRSAMA